jgi:hypothetical protein
MRASLIKFDNDTMGTFRVSGVELHEGDRVNVLFKSSGIELSGEVTIAGGLLEPQEITVHDAHYDDATDRIIVREP